MQKITEALVHLKNLFYPENCPVCYRLLKANEANICTPCETKLPVLPYRLYDQNPIEILFYNNSPIQGASAYLSFVEKGIAQKLIHQHKYKGDIKLGNYLGNKAGFHLLNQVPTYVPDLIIPVPLHFSKKKKRGFNQAEIIADGIAEVYLKKVANGVVRRKTGSQSQTKKNKYERFKNMAHKFAVSKPSEIKDKHILIVDDVITTGATTSSLCNEILKHFPKSVVVYALAFKV